MYVVTTIMEFPRQPTPPATAARYVEAKLRASAHRVHLEASTRCACFFCFRTFAVRDITSWIDKNQTALCPGCGLDAVIGNGAGRSIDDRFLRGMHAHFFAYRTK